ncbi:MAG: hypothetical protein RR761_14930, partial [Aeromonas sp.]|uniref:hypothetical protein n=1 Tax=Aeromonas sp. TaxID=647 RepID=UPI002FC847D8
FFVVKFPDVAGAGALLYFFFFFFPPPPPPLLECKKKALVDESTSNPLLDDLPHTPYFIHWPQAGRCDKISACFISIWSPDERNPPQL